MTMPKKKRPEQTYESQMQIFVKQLKQSGVTDKTIQKVIEEMQDYQQKEMAKQLAEMFKRWKQIIKESIENDGRSK